MAHLLVLFLLLASFSNAQTTEGSCQPFEGAPRSQCSSVVDYDVFVPEGLTQSDLDATSAERTGLFLLGTTSQDCSVAALRFECAEVFKRCYEAPAGPYGEIGTSHQLSIFSLALDALQ